MGVFDVFTSLSMRRTATSFLQSLQSAYDTRIIRSEHETKPSSSVATLVQGLTEATKELEAMNQEVRSKAAEVDKLKAVVEAQRDTVEKLVEKRNRNLVTKAMVDGKIAELKGRLERAKELFIKSKSRYEAARESCKNERARLEQKAAELAEREEKKTEILNAIENMKAEKQGMLNELEAIEHEKKAKGAETEELKKNIETARGSLEVKKQKINSSRNDLDALKKRIASILEKNKSMEADIQEKKSGIEQTRKDIENLQQDIERLKAKNEACENELRETEKKKQEVVSPIEVRIEYFDALENTKRMEERLMAYLKAGGFIDEK